MQLGQHALEQAFFGPPDALLAQGHGQGLACVDGVAHAFEGTDVFSQGIQRHHFAFAFGLQTIQYPLYPWQVAAQHRFAELEHIVAGYIQHGRLNLAGTEFAGRIQQRQFLNFLMCGQQVAFDPIGKKAQGMFPFRASGHVLVLLAQALRNPLWQLLAADAFNGNVHPVLLQGGVPGCVFDGFIEPGQGNEQEQIAISCHALCQRG